MRCYRRWGAVLLVACGLSEGRTEDCAEPVAAEAGDRVAVEAMLVRRCGECHRGPFLDFSKTPFFSDTFTTERALLVESLRRAKLDGDWKRMPPLNRSPLSADEIALLERFVAELR